MAREEQRYQHNPVLPFCGNCEHYQSVWVENEWGDKEEKKRRCSLGDFAVKRKGSCSRHALSVAGE